MAEIAAIVGLCVCCAVGLVLTALRLPGTWLIVAAATAFGWWTDWERVTLGWIALLVGLALLGEITELLASVITARRAGASRQAGWGGLIGGLVGMLIFSIPIPIIGTIFGALLGCFVGAAISEFVFARDANGCVRPTSTLKGATDDGVRSMKVGFFAAIGFVLGTAAKTAIALVLAGLLLTSVFCSSTPAP